MTEQATTEAVRKSVTVPLSRESAFELFVDEFADWWPLSSHHIGERQAAEVVIEPREGGRWFERDQSGTECEWGSVLAVERPRRIVLAWQLSPNYEFDPDRARATEVEVSFEAQGEASTRVTVEHRGFEVHGEAAGAMRDSVGGEGGWATLLELYAESARG
jgi:uncharacterized protein YndB with AHSA1/START domain